MKKNFLNISELNHLIFKHLNQYKQIKINLLGKYYDLNQNNIFDLLQAMYMLACDGSNFFDVYIIDNDLCIVLTDLLKNRGVK